MLKIKVCGMTDPANTHEIAALPVDFLGFIFYKYSKRFVGDSPDENLFHSIPVNIMKTGVFVDDEPSAIIKCARKYCLDFIQLHGNESPRVCSALRKNEVKIIKAFRISPDFDFIALNKYMEKLDVERQEPNVLRMRMLGAEVVPVMSGNMTLKDATSMPVSAAEATPSDHSTIILTGKM